MPDDHSEVVPLLPIPNRTVKRLCADDSADSRVKVGHRQATTALKTPSASSAWGFCFARPAPTAHVEKPPLGGFFKSQLVLSSSRVQRGNQDRKEVWLPVSDKALRTWLPPGESLLQR